MLCFIALFCLVVVAKCELDFTILHVDSTDGEQYEVQC